jgi:hypothetical protein
MTVCCSANIEIKKASASETSTVPSPWRTDLAKTMIYSGQSPAGRVFDSGVSITAPSTFGHFESVAEAMNPSFFNELALLYGTSADEVADVMIQANSTGPTWEIVPEGTVGVGNRHA